MVEPRVRAKPPIRPGLPIPLPAVSPRASGSRLAVIAGVAVLLVLFMAGLAARGQTVQYVYDELGRLVAVVDTSGAAAVYHYDAVGNLLAITRQNAGVVSILEFTPDAERPGRPSRCTGRASAPRHRRTR